MAKKKTLEKRAKKVQKEEHLVLGGNTKGKKQGVKKSTSSYKGRPAKGKPAASGEKSEQGDQKTTRSPRVRGRATDPGKSGERWERTNRLERSDRTERSDRSERTDRRERSSGSSSRSPRATGRSTGGKFGDPKFKRGSGPSRGEKPKYKLTREGDAEKRHVSFEKDKFKNKGQARDKFRKNDKKKSYGKFTEDNRFEGFEQRGKKPTDEIRLNKYLSMAGVCSRREADTFIEQGLVSVNGEIVTQLGTKVKPTDEVRYAGERVRAEVLRYVLLNKPKDCITTLNDERDRSTVMGLVKNACKERIYPVGRLDRNTTGLLLLTNDGEMAKKLTHPSHEVRKVYHVITDKNVSIADLKKLESGIELEDGIAKADAALFAGDGSVRTEIGLEIHSGKNRVVRRMFAAMGYEVVRLDRAAFAGLSKKGLPRGRWRFLTEKEISYLKML